MVIKMGVKLMGWRRKKGGGHRMDRAAPAQFMV